MFKKLLISIVGLLQCVEVSAQTYKWDNVAMGGGGFVSAIITSKTEKDLMYARTDVGGAYKWDATNQQWNSLLDWASADQTGYLGVEALAIDPQAANKLYMLVGINYFNNGSTAILKSSDYGKTFTTIDVTSKFKAHGNGMGRQNGERLVVDPNNSNLLFCGIRANGLFKSTDAGLSWNAVSSFAVSTTANANGISLVVIDPKSGTKGNASQTMIVGVSTYGTNLYISKNGGTSFAPISGAPTTYMPQRAALSSDGNLFITYGNGAGPHGADRRYITNEDMNNGQIWKYNISTGSWANVSPANYAFSGISVDPNNAQRLIASTTNLYLPQYTSVYGDRLFLSTDGGTSWKDLVGNNGINLDANGCTWVNGHSIHWAGCIEFDPFNTNKAWVTSGNGIFTCDDIAATKTTWKFSIKGLEETVPFNAISIVGGPLVSIIGDYDGFRHTDPTLYAPIHTPRTGTTTGLAYASSGNASLMVRAGNDMYYSTDIGLNWAKCTNNGAKGKVAISADAKVILHCPEGYSTMYYSTDKGANWTNCNGISFSDIVPIADAVNASKFYAYEQTTGKFFISTDGGKNFSNSLTISSWGSKIMRSVPAKEGDIWLAGYWDGLKRSTNSGTSFTKFANVQECSAVGFGKAATGKTFPTVYIWGKVNNVVGVYRSTDEGTNWVRVNDDAHQYGGPGNGQFVTGDMNVYGRVYMSTAGRGIAYGELSNVTSVENESVDTRSESVNCYPNPFTGTFTIHTSGDFTYDVYNMTGNSVASGNANSSVVIGSELPVGMYVVKTQGNNGTKVSKVIKK